MIEIKIISATPGANTRQQILQIIQSRDTGITVKEISKMINRPRSMIQVCLRNLIASKAIITRQNKAGVGLIYYPKEVQAIKKAS